MTVHSRLFPDLSSNVELNTAPLPPCTAILHQLGIHSIDKQGQAMLKALTAPNRGNYERSLKFFMNKYSKTPDALNIYDSLVDSDGGVYFDYVEENDRFYSFHGEIDVQSKIHTASFPGGVLAESRDDSIYFRTIQTLITLIRLADIKNPGSMQLNIPSSKYQLLSFKSVFG